jgi:hypothetical protein
MARNSSGVYSLVAGNPVITGTTIESNWANNTMTDVGNEMTDSLSRSGKGGMTAPLKNVSGTATLPAVVASSFVNTGMYWASATDLRMAVNGVDRFRYRATGLPTQTWDVTTGVWVDMATVDTAKLATGTDTYTAAGISDQIDDQLYTVLFANANTGASTINGKAIVNRLGIAMQSGDINTSSEIALRYDLANDRFVYGALVLKCQAYAGGSATVTSGVPLSPNFNVEDYDNTASHPTGGTGDAATAIFTVPTGITRAKITAQCTVNSISGGVSFKAFTLQKNGVQLAYGTTALNLANSGLSTVPLPTSCGWVNVVAGDEFKGLLVSATTTTVAGNVNTFFQIEYE